MKDAASKSQRKVTGEIPQTFTPRFWESADRRVATVREIESRVAELKADCGADSRQKQMIAERAAFIAVQLETSEVDALGGKPFDAGSYVQACNALLGLLRALGLEKRARKIGLADYVGGKGGAA